MIRVRAVAGGLLVALLALLLVVAPAHAGNGKKGGGKGERIMRAVKGYEGQTTFACRTDAIPIYPGQNLNDFNPTRTCPNAEKLKGPLDASIFDEGSTAEGYVTRFKPSMVEVKPNGKLVTPSVWDLHLHHVVWILPDLGPTFAAGEEKTIPKAPQGYGFKVGADERWTINQMIHNLTASEGREVYITWVIDWVPETSPERTDIEPLELRWLDVAGLPQIYPVFDAERGFDTDGDGRYVFPDEVPTDPAAPGYEEREKISNRRMWTVPKGGATLVFGTGHLHPGGLSVDLFVTRDGQTRRLFKSKARYYEPAGAVSWDVSMKATPRRWRVSLQEGDRVHINATYDVRKASWYEAMGIFPLAWARSDDPKARDPFTEREEFREMKEGGGTLTHGRLPENIDTPARKKLGLPDPRDLRSKGTVAKGGIDIQSFVYSQGGFSAVRNFPKSVMRPPTIEPGETVSFTNSDAPFGIPQTEQVWHSITSCKPPCNKGSGIGYPLANGPKKFDSGQLGFGENTSRGVTTSSDSYTTPKLNRPGSTVTYFCRIHPFMRGSVRVEDRKERKQVERDIQAAASGALSG